MKRVTLYWIDETGEEGALGTLHVDDGISMRDVFRLAMDAHWDDRLDGASCRARIAVEEV